MSVYSYIEVMGPNGERLEDKKLNLGFGHGIGWYHQIAVAGGERNYKGVQYSGNSELMQLEEACVVSTYKLDIHKSMQNYDMAIRACSAALQLKIWKFDRWLFGDLETLFEARAWFKRAQYKVPNGVVLLDWCEAAWGMSEEDVERWDSPNGNFAFFQELEKNCELVRAGELSINMFSKKYREQSRSTGFTTPYTTYASYDPTNFPF